MSAHRSFKELETDIEAIAAVYPVGAEYEHYKTPGSCYRVVGHGVIEETDEVAIEYISPEHPTVKFIRPISVWNETVQHEGRTVPRFRKLETT